MMRARRTMSSRLGVLLIGVGLAAVWTARPAQAKNQGCCVLNQGCTTATATICRLLGGSLQGVGSQVCNNDRCGPGVGCASCFGGPYAGDLCEQPAECGDGGVCLTNITNPEAPNGLRDGRFALLREVEVQLPVRQYAAKFVCGNPVPRGVDLAAGEYRTIINVHNPQLERTAIVRHKVAVARPGLEVGPITPFETLSVIADGAFQVDCPTILARLDEAIFAEGFVVLQSPFELDVVAVYTAADPQGTSGTPTGSRVRSLQTERVPGRLVP